METKHCAACGETKPVDEFYRDKTRRDGLQSSCRVCQKARAKAWVLANPERAKAKTAARVWTPAQLAANRVRVKAWAKVNPEKRAAQGKLYQQRHPEKVNAAGRKWRAENPEKYQSAFQVWKDANPGYNAAYASENRGRGNAREALRRASKHQHTPSWAHLGAVARFYEIARKMGGALNMPWHVDHIVPLKSPLVCGLHVQNNLRIIRGVENLAKGNRWWPDMP